MFLPSVIAVIERFDGVSVYLPGNVLCFITRTGEVVFVGDAFV